MKELQKVCLSIAGLDPSGGAGILADVRAFAAFGCFPAAAVTSLTYQNTQGVFGSENQSGEVVERQIMPILDDYSLGAVKTGMLPSAEVIEAVARVLRQDK
ncbi:MAG: bifunctional hydroxymethylpyrimidine kinase/phosphomethylpyrimidine kinase [Acidobacteria bacterium]|nr:bifunctional hydroxymethylpyrimidine kinase/phosphomethylpyrimidine kinase [Acidobacteriota bacterium]